MNQSVLSLQLASFALVALPLLLGLIVASVQIERGTRHSEQLLEGAILANQSARLVSERLTRLERAARQFRVLQDNDARRGLHERQKALAAALHGLGQATDDTAIRDLVNRMSAADRGLLQQLERLDQDGEWPERLATRFEVLHEQSTTLILAAESAAERELRQLKDMGETARSLSMLSLISAVPIAVILALLMAGFLNRQIRRLDQAMRAMAQPDKARGERIRTPRDLRALSSRLEWLRRRLTRTERDRQELVGQVSHELKTPLSAIREGTSLLSDQSFGALGEQQREVIGIIETNISRLQGQIENLLRFNRLQSRPKPSIRSAVRLADVVEEVLAAHRLTIETRNISIEGRPWPDIRFAADPDMLSTSMDNLVSNALKFSPSGGRVGIFLARSAGQVLIRVADCGPGIQRRDRARIFQAFSRGSDPRTRSHPGSGLGLAICRDLVRAQHGELRLVDSRSWSTVVEIRLPFKP